MGLFDLFKKKDIESPQEVNRESSTSVTSKIEVAVEFEGPPSLEELLKKAIPSKQGLYPHELIMLEYAPSFKTSNNQFQQFWYYRYSVTEPQIVLNSLYERGFIDVGDLKCTLEKLKVPEIKEELRNINQKLTGKKSEIIDRLMENGDLDYLNEKYYDRYYVLTKKGNQELEDNPYISYLHRKQYMTIWEMNQRIANTHYPYRDILWGYFNEQADVHFQNFDFGFYRNTRLNMYEFLMEENKYKMAFKMLCHVLAFDLSGLGNGEDYKFELERTDPRFYWHLDKISVENHFPYESSTLKFTTTITGWYAEMQKKLEMDDKCYREALLQELNEIHPPRRIFSNEECADIVIASINNDIETLTTIFKEAEKREKARLQEIKSRIK